jgi:hypothetical protein
MFMRNDSTIANDGTLSPVERLRKRDAAAKTYAGTGGFDAVGLERKKVENAEEEYQRAIAVPADLTGVTTEVWRRRVEEAYNTPEFEGVPKREQLRDSAITRGIAAIQDRNYDAWTQRQTQFENLLQNGTPQALQQAETLAARGAEQRDQVANGGGDSYSPEQRRNISRMLRMPDSGGGRGSGGGSLNSFFDDLIQQNLRGLDGAVAGVDERGNRLQPGISLSETYRKIDAYAVEAGRDPQELRNEYTSRLLQATSNAMTNTFRLDEGATVLRALVDITQSDITRYNPKYKLEKDEESQLEIELAQSVINEWASWQQSDDHSPQAERALIDRLHQIKNGYLGAVLSERGLLRDIPGTSETQYRNSGNLTQAAKGYAEVLSNPAVATRSRTGSGYYTPESMNDSVASYISVAQGLLHEDLGFAEGSITLENGKELIATSPSGTVYRIRGTEQGEWYLDEQKTEEQRDGRQVQRWTPVAKRSGGGRSGWFSTDTQGRVKRTAARPTTGATSYMQAWGSNRAGAGEVFNVR